MSLNNLGTMAISEENFILARSYFNESLVIWREMESKAQIAMTLHNLGNLTSRQEDYASACSYINENLMIHYKVGNKPQIASSLLALGMLRYMRNIPVVSNQAEHSVCLFAASEALRESMSLPFPLDDRSEYDNILSGAREILGDEAFLSAWRRGQNMTVEEACNSIVDG